MKIYKDGKLIEDNTSSAGKLAPVLADMTLGKAYGLYGELSDAKGFAENIQDGSGDAVDKTKRAVEVAEFAGPKLSQGSSLVAKGTSKLSKVLDTSSQKAISELGKLAKPVQGLQKGASIALKGASKAAETTAKAAGTASKALKSIPATEALTVAQSVRDLSGGTRSNIQMSDHEKASTALGGTAALVGGTATAAGASGTVAAGSAAAGIAAAGGAGVMATVSAGLAAIGPIGWATLALGAGAAALGIFGDKQRRR